VIILVEIICIEPAGILVMHVCVSVVLSLFIPRSPGVGGSVRERERERESQGEMMEVIRRKDSNGLFSDNSDNDCEVCVCVCVCVCVRVP